MALSRKNDKQQLNKKIQNDLVKEEIFTRVSYVSDEEMKQFKIHSINTGIDMRDLLDQALKDIMKSPPKEFKAIDKNAKRRSFAIKADTLTEMKRFVVEHSDLTLDRLIYNALTMSAIKTN